MIKYCLFLILLAIWSISFYSHFWNVVKSDTMVAFVGLKRTRDFATAYGARGVDLWIFGPKRRTSRHMRFGRNPFQTFRQSSYSKMLLLEHPVSVPYHLHLKGVVEYVSGNTTLASLWPRLSQWPPNNVREPLEWYRRHKGHVTKIIV